MCTYFKTETDVAQNLIHNFFSNFGCQRTFPQERLMNSYIEEKLFEAASALSLSSRYKVSAFSEINPIPHIFFTQNLSYERSPNSPSQKKHYQIFELHQLSFRNTCTFESSFSITLCITLKMIKFNRRSCLKNQSSTKLNHIFIV